MGSISGMEPASTHDETSSSDRTGKDDDDAGGSDDDSDDRVDPQHHDPERLKAFNVSDSKDLDITFLPGIFDIQEVRTF